MPGSCLRPVLRGTHTPHRRHQGEVGGTHLLTGVSWSQTRGSRQSAALHLQAGGVWLASVEAELTAGSSVGGGPRGRGTGRRCGRAEPRVADTASGLSPQAAPPMPAVLRCLRQTGAGEPPWGKEAARSLPCPWQHGHITACRGIEGSP